MLAALPPLPRDHDDGLGWDDLILYPPLRNLARMRGLRFPAPGRAYIDAVIALTGSRTYFGRAC